MSYNKSKALLFRFPFISSVCADNGRGWEGFYVVFAFTG